MAEKLNAEAEIAKLNANFWNSLALAAVVLGALPFVMGFEGGHPAPLAEFDWATFFVRASAAAFAVALSSVFRALAARAIRKAS